MFNLAEYRHRPAVLADYLPWAGLVAPGVVLNKDGSFQRTARFRGPDLESATASELVATTARLNNALSAWGPAGRSSSRPSAAPRLPIRARPFPDALSWLVDRERRAAFESAGSHFESAYTLTLLCLPPPEAQARAGRVHARIDGDSDGSTGASTRARSSTRPTASLGFSRA